MASLRNYRSCNSLPNTQGGTVLVEFLLVFPLLVLVFLASYEFSLVLRAQQLMHTVARESAKEAFRECSALAQGICPTGDSASSRCLIRVRASHSVLLDVGESFVADYIENADLVLSVYDSRTVAGVTEVYRSGIASASDCASTKTCSKLDESKVRADANLAQLIKDKDILVVAEVYATYNSVFSDYLPSSALDKLRHYERLVF